MQKGISCFLSMLLIFLLAAPAQTTRAEEQSMVIQKNNAYVEGEVLVTLASPEQTGLAKEGTASFDENITIENTWDFGEAKSIADTPAEEKKFQDKTLYVSEIHSDSYTTEELVDELKSRKNVLSVEPNYYRYKMDAGSDTYVNQQWYLDGEGAYHEPSPGIHYKDMTSPDRQEETVVAVVDTGIDYTHEDLADHMWINPYPSSLAGTYGYDYGDHDSDPMDEDEDGHGTHCAGIISAVSDNQTGIRGISNARLMALKVFNSAGEASDSSIVGAFNYIYQAQSLGVNIAAINCSWGGGGATSASLRSLIEKIGEKGGLFIFSAGNYSTNRDSAPGKLSCPYDLDSNYVVTVGASDGNDKKAYFSDYGKNTVDLFAPGERIFSTVNSGVFYPFLYPEEKRKQLCEFFTSLDTADTMLYTGPEVGRDKRNISYLWKKYSDNDYYGDPASGSLCIFISSFRNTGTVELYLDVTELNLNASNRYYMSYDLGTMEDGTLSWDHYMATSTSGNFVTYEGRTYLQLVRLSGNFRSVSALYLDNLGISRANVEPSALGKYNTLSGTSMAAPQVSAAVALLASAYDSDKADQRRNKLLSCVRKTENLSSYCITGGILDLSKIQTPPQTLPEETPQNTTTSNGNTSANNTTTENTPETVPLQKTTTKTFVTKIKLNKKKATLRYGKKLKLKATVTPKNASNKKITWYVSNKKYATVTQKGVVRATKKGIGHTVKVYVKAKDQSGKKAYCKIQLVKRKK